MTLKVISQGHSPFARIFKCNPSNICAAFYQIQLTALHDQLSPKWAWLRSRDCLKFWANKTSVISRKLYNIETYFQWKTNRKSYVAHRIAPVLVTLNDLEGHSPVAGLFKCNPSNICAVFYQVSTDSALASSLSDSWASSSPVKIALLWEKDY